jgi:hypothetical protein
MTRSTADLDRQRGQRVADRRGGLPRSAVHQHVDRPPRQPHRGDHHEHGDEQRGNRVAARVAGPHDDQADEHGDRSGQVRREVQRVGGQRGRLVAPRRPRAGDGPGGVDADDHDDHQQRPPGDIGRAARAEQPAQRLERDERGDQRQHGALGQRGEVLRLAVAVVVLAIRGAHGQPHGEQREQRRDQVGGRVRRLGDQAQRPGGQAGGQLDRHEHDRGDHAEPRGALARAVALGLGLEPLLVGRRGHVGEGRSQRRLIAADRPTASAMPA